MSMAGRIAEHKYHGLGNGRFDDDEALETLDLARRIHRGEEMIDEDSEWSGDCTEIALTLVDANPAITDNEYTKALRAYQKKTRSTLNKLAVWRAVKKVAEALLHTGRLTDAEARAAIAGEDVFGHGSAEILGHIGLDVDSVRNITLARLERSR
jgi:hypothetical protein